MHNVIKYHVKYLLVMCTLSCVDSVHITHTWISGLRWVPAPGYDIRYTQVLQNTENYVSCFMFISNWTQKEQGSSPGAGEVKHAPGTDEARVGSPFILGFMV